MYIQRTRLAPAPGKGPALEALLVEAVKSAHAKGRRISLGRRILSSHGPAFVVTTLSPDLAGLDAIRRDNMTDADFQSRAAKIAPLLADGVKTIVLEGIVDAPPRDGMTISVLTAAYPAPGKEQQIVAILKEWASGMQGAGVALSLNRRIFSSDGPMLAAIGRYPDLADFDRVRKERTSTTRPAAIAVGDLSRSPITQRLTENIVPMPAA